MYTKKSIVRVSLLLVLLGVALLSYNNKKTKTKELTASPTLRLTASTGELEISATTTSLKTLGTETVKKENTPVTINLALRTNAEWKKVLSPNQYAVLREGATEKPYTSPLLSEKRKGSYVTADCGELVFRSEQKFDSGTGWPSFYAPAAASAVKEKKDTELGVERTEIVSAKCGSHLGHVFNDAPQTPTGLRYCINGIALRFIPD